MASGIAEESWLKNALLESFVIHARVLIDFFYALNPQKDDVIAEDFLSSPDVWRNERPKLSERLSEAKERANKHLAHLTYQRVDVALNNREWPFVEISKDMRSVMKRFLEKVSADNLGTQFTQMLCSKKET